MLSNLEMILLTVGSIFTTPIMNICNFTNGEDGLDYYAEVHLSSWNSCVHTIGMPFTFYGISCWVPPLFNLSNKNMNKMQLYLWYLIFMHYISINFFSGLFCTLFYVYPMILAYGMVKTSSSKWLLFKHGMIYSVLALVVQEYFGHYLGGDDLSRIEAIPNAIAYSVYYSTYHLV